ncbi:hypothetical protein [Polynucleobacter sp. MWH-Berg-3C6]|uniref:hypothetical protein n=1 Tax=Polynucleobacter sp. MWH-Berg-3C6 TaxID=1855882 RepID=UPI001C0AF416|nr:hypothetical protein [Polynucleobacter sp. MWH-Berg-3C6]MBU3549902.1 hypothetical protein [Polynucleobacter sp. MWH-Berg-3C6]
MFKVNIVTPQESWVLRDIGQKLSHSLVLIGVETAQTKAPLENYDIYHWIGALGNDYVPNSINTGLLAHIDTVRKRMALLNHARKMDGLVCMSNNLKILAAMCGWAEDRLITGYIPALSSVTKQSNERLVNFFISTNLYDDGRKNEYWIAQYIRKFPGSYKFNVMGEGWLEFVEKYQDISEYFIVYPKFNSEIYDVQLRDCDYAMYLGFDEGSMFIMDALTRDKSVFIADGGWHDEFGLLSNYKFTNQPEFESKLMHLLQYHEKRSDFLRQANWSFYADTHYQFWLHLKALSQNQKRVSIPNYKVFFRMHGDLA